MSKPEQITLFTVTYSPCPDDKVPFSYEEDGLISWVDEVFLEGYKQDQSAPEGAPFPSLDECLDILLTNGYTVDRSTMKNIEWEKAEEQAKSIVSLLIEREPGLETWHGMLRRRVEALLTTLDYETVGVEKIAPAP